MPLKPFRLEDLARLAMTDGALLGWETGLGKTWAKFLWPLLKVGHQGISTFKSEISNSPPLPAAPVLIIAPGDLHAQITQEGWDRFRVQLGTRQKERYEAALVARYLDKNGKPAPGAKLAALRQAAA